MPSEKKRNSGGKSRILRTYRRHTWILRARLQRNKNTKCKSDSYEHWAKEQKNHVYLHLGNLYPIDTLTNSPIWSRRYLLLKPLFLVSMCQMFKVYSLSVLERFELWLESPCWRWSTEKSCETPIAADTWWLEDVEGAGRYCTWLILGGSSQFVDG